LRNGRKNGNLPMSKRDVWIVADSIVSPLGVTSLENYKNIRANKTGISVIDNPSLSKDQIPAGWINQKKINAQIEESIPAARTQFESYSILSVKNALLQIQLDPASEKTLFILSTTKGNIELLEQGRVDAEGIHLHEAAIAIASHFGNMNNPLVVSNACISGVMALLVGKRLIQAGVYDHVVVTGADVLTNFVLSGFQSLSAISPEACKPFDAKRKGVTLGEAAATIVLSADPTSIKGEKKIKVLGGSISNDANHISGPSRTGEELAMAVKQALKDAGIDKSEVDFISAHGTATSYNDEMESKAFNHAELSDVPLNSLKGYFGHTLGAAGIVETIISAHALLNNELIPTFGFEASGVSMPLNIIKAFESKNLSTCLKTASGFGGCNAAIVIKKV
jgi:3-oxoacyl-[acyl-carrier-protein] synthase I